MSYRSPGRKYMVCDRRFKNHREDPIKDEIPGSTRPLPPAQPQLMLPADAVSDDAPIGGGGGGGDKENEDDDEHAARQPTTAPAKVPALLVLCR